MTVRRLASGVSCKWTVFDGKKFLSRLRRMKNGGFLISGRRAELLKWVSYAKGFLISGGFNGTY